MADNELLKEIALKRQLDSIANCSTLTVPGIEYVFADILLFGDAVSVSLPAAFQPMGEESAALKYPSVHRPEAIYSCDEGAVAITFDLSDAEASPEDIPVTLLGLRSSIKRLHPANTFFEHEVEENTGWFDYRSYAIDGDLYNILFISVIGGKLLLGSFSCPYESRHPYAPFAHKIIASVREAQREVG